MIQRENPTMDNMDSTFSMIKIKRSTKSVLSKGLFMISVGIKKDKTLSLSVDLCHHILLCLIKITRKFSNLELITETKLFGEILVDSYVWLVSEIWTVKWKFGICKPTLKLESVNLIQHLIANGHMTIVNWSQVLLLLV